jgi:hypothetical protein
LDAPVLGSRPGSLPVPGTAAQGKEDIPVNKRDKARNTAQTAKGNAKRAAGKAAGESACPG